MALGNGDDAVDAAGGHACARIRNGRAIPTPETSATMPPVDVQLDELRTELKHARDELDAWSHGLSGDARKAKHEHEHAMARARAESAALVEREQALSHAVEALAQRAAPPPARPACAHHPRLQDWTRRRRRRRR